VAGPPATHDDTTPREPGADEPAHEGNIEVWVADGGTAERRWRFEGDEFSIGGHPTNQLVLRDGAVSRFHCEVRLDGTALAIRDLDSRNGTFVDGVRVKEAYLRAGCLVRLGRSALRIGAQPGPHAPELSERGAFGELVGDSTPMRAVFAVLERAAQSHATVLLEGETGTGKGAAALGLHQAGPRRGKPFQIVDCGSIPAGLVESELFGHEKGAFTGADAPRAGAFEAASGGTIFLDEVGELPLEIQPKLLRAIEERTVRRLGSTQMRPVDVRVVAASNRDLRAAVNEGSFRADLYYRLAVVRLHLPALRDRLSDLPLLVERLVDLLGGSPEQRETLTAAPFLAALRRAPWRGNVRELRNYLEQCLVLDRQLPPHDLDGRPAPPGTPYQEARRQALDDFERGYFDDLLRRHHNNVADAAEAAGLSRVYVYRILAKHGLLR